MKKMHQFVLVLCLLSAVMCSPFDDGKYRPRIYDEYDDGKYYRPLDEGKYIPGDEGKYTYIYRQGMWPFDGTYQHRIGPNGEIIDDPYMGYRVYASRYPYVNGVIKALVSKYISSDIIDLEEGAEASTNHYSRVFADKEVAVKCNYLNPKSNGSEFRRQYPPQMKLKKGEKYGTFYSFQGSKVLSTVSNALTSQIKLEYEVFVRIVDEVSRPNKDYIPSPPKSSPPKKSKPSDIELPKTDSELRSKVENSAGLMEVLGIPLVSKDESGMPNTISTTNMPNDLQTSSFNDGAGIPTILSPTTLPNLAQTAAAIDDLSIPTILSPTTLSSVVQTSPASDDFEPLLTDNETLPPNDLSPSPTDDDLPTTDDNQN